MVDHVNQTRAANIITSRTRSKSSTRQALDRVQRRSARTPATTPGDASHPASGSDVILIGRCAMPRRWAPRSPRPKPAISSLDTAHGQRHRDDQPDRRLLPPGSTTQTRLTLAAVLRGVISQRWCQGPTATESARHRGSREHRPYLGRIVDHRAGMARASTNCSPTGIPGDADLRPQPVRLFKSGEDLPARRPRATTNPHDFRVTLQNAGVLPPRDRLIRWGRVTRPVGGPP